MLRNWFIRYINAVVQRDVVLWVIGALNRHTNLLSTIFVMYPATKGYQESYVDHRHLEKMKWKPWIVGFFFQNGKFGLKTVISSTEEEFQDPTNKDAMKGMVEDARLLAKTVGANQISFSGVLPGILNKHRIIKGSVEARVTVAAIVKAEAEMRKRLGYSDCAPVVLLGGGGFIGRRVARSMSYQNVLIVDPLIDGSDMEGKWLKRLKDQEVIVLNIATPKALENIASKLWTNAVILNEVYPEPDRQTVQALESIGCKIYHIAGLKAISVPSFPGAYNGGIPCCAGRLDSKMKPLIASIT